MAVSASLHVLLALNWTGTSLGLGTGHTGDWDWGAGGCCSSAATDTEPRRLHLRGERKSCARQRLTVSLCLWSTTSILLMRSRGGCEMSLHSALEKLYLPSMICRIIISCFLQHYTSITFHCHNARYINKYNKRDIPPDLCQNGGKPTSMV